MGKTSRIPGFHKLTIDERLRIVEKFAALSNDDIAMLSKRGSMDIETADRMIENVIGTFELPFGVAANMIVNGEEYLIPMTVEEPSVVAGITNAARIARSGGGFFTSSTGPIMIAQIQAVNVKDPHGARLRLYEEKDEILRIANEQDPVLVKIGGGAREIEVRIIETALGQMLIVHLIVDTRDAMGANVVNTMAEAVAPYISEWTGGRVYLRILSNLADKRLVRARVRVKKEEFRDSDVLDGIIYAWAFADADPYRATTHNKGIMNGISPLVIATGNDFRAIEAGAHAYAARTGRYRSLTQWETDQGGDLVGTIELPMAVGLVGGATTMHPLSKIAIKILRVKTATELGEIIGAVGLCQNLGALRALAAEGIQKGHMALHAKNIAVSAGAKGDLIDVIAKRMVEEAKVRMDRAQELLKEFEET